MHGSHFIAMKTFGAVHRRSREIARRAWWGTLVTSLAAIVAVSQIRPQVWDNYSASPWGLAFPVGGAAGLLLVPWFRRRQNDAGTLFASGAFISGMLGATAFGLFPVLLPASTDPAFSLTITNASAREYGLGVGVVWFTLGIILALGYLGYILRLQRGKLKLPSEGEGY
jgi:cytochrome d ubiquinol oxidase subunit II